MSANSTPSLLFSARKTPTSRTKQQIRKAAQLKVAARAAAKKAAARPKKRDPPAPFKPPPTQKAKRTRRILTQQRGCCFATCALAGGGGAAVLRDCKTNACQRKMHHMCFLQQDKSDLPDNSVRALTNWDESFSYCDGCSPDALARRARCQSRQGRL